MKKNNREKKINNKTCKKYSMNKNKWNEMKNLKLKLN